MNYGIFLENDDMTENSDSGFTEINQTGSNDTSQNATSKTATPEHSVKQPEELGESAETPEISKVLDNSAGHASSSRSVSKSSSNSDSSSSDDSDDDYDASKPSVLNWVC